MSGNVDLGIGALETLRTVPFWRTDEVPRHVARRMLVIPGVRYSCDRPLLNWTSTIAHQHGWWVQQAQWELTPQTNQEEIIARALELLDHDAPDADQTMVVAKSMGSRAASTASANGWCGIWLTPLLDVEEVRAALLEYHGPSLIAGERHRSPQGPDDSVRTVLPPATRATSRANSTNWAPAGSTWPGQPFARGSRRPAPASRCSAACSNWPTASSTSCRSSAVRPRPSSRHPHFREFPGLVH